MFSYHTRSDPNARLPGGLILLLSLAVWLGGFASDVRADLLISSFATDQVKRYNSTTGAFVNNFASGGGLDGPSGLVYGSDGSLYVSSFATDQVKRYNGTTGAFIDNFASGGGLDGPRDLVFGPDGNLYVISGNNDLVKRYDGTTGAFIDTFTSGGGLGQFLSLAFGPDGNLYVGTFLLRVNRYDGTTGVFTDIYTSGIVDEPTGLAYGADAKLYVSSSFTDKVVRVSGPSGAIFDDFVAFGSGGLDSPGALLFGPDGNLYVSSTSTDQVKRYNGTTGAFIDNFASGGGLDGITGLVFTPATVPEPGGVLLLITGLAGLVVARRVRRRDFRI